MEEDESLVQATDSVSIPSKKESGYFEENCGDLSDVIFSNYNHYGALLSVDTAGILIINETRRSDHWEESRQGSSFSSGLVEDINDLDVNDTDEVKDDIVIIKHPEEARRDVTDASDVVHSPEGSKEFLCTHEDSAAVLRIPENHEKNIDSEVQVCIHTNSKAVVYIRKSPEVIDCTKEDSTSVECATSPSTIAEDWNDAELSVCDTGKTVSVDNNDVTSSSYGSFCSCTRNHVFIIRTLLIRRLVLRCLIRLAYHHPSIVRKQSSFVSRIVFCILIVKQKNRYEKLKRKRKAMCRIFKTRNLCRPANVYCA